MRTSYTCLISLALFELCYLVYSHTHSVYQNYIVDWTSNIQSNRTFTLERKTKKDGGTSVQSATIKMYFVTLN